MFFHFFNSSIGLHHDSAKLKVLLCSTQYTIHVPIMHIHFITQMRNKNCTHPDQNNSLMETPLNSHANACIVHSMCLCSAAAVHHKPINRIGTSAHIFDAVFYMCVCAYAPCKGGAGEPAGGRGLMESAKHAGVCAYVYGLENKTHNAAYASLSSHIAPKLYLVDAHINTHTPTHTHMCVCVSYLVSCL